MLTIAVAGPTLSGTGFIVRLLRPSELLHAGISGTRKSTAWQEPSANMGEKNPERLPVISQGSSAPCHRAELQRYHQTR